MKTLVLIGMGLLIVFIIYDIARVIREAFRVFENGAMPGLEDIDP